MEKKKKERKNLAGRSKKEEEMTFIPERMENLSAVSGWNDSGFFFFFFSVRLFIH